MKNETFDYTEIGKQIRLAREKKNKTQSWLAAKAGLKQPTIAQLEAGLYFTNSETLNAIFDALDLRLTYCAVPK